MSSDSIYFMKKNFLTFIKIIRIILFACLCVEVMFFIGGLIFNFSNPEIKGLSLVDFLHITLSIVITFSLLILVILLTKKINMRQKTAQRHCEARSNPE